MPQAKVDSLDAIKQFRAAFIKFAESVSAALGNADSDVTRTENWLEGEAKTYWQNEIRKAQVKLAAAQEALRMKTLYKNLDGTTPSAVDEKKAVTICKARLELATHKLDVVRRFSGLLQRESVLYKGSTQRFATTIQAGTPRGIAFLNRVMDAIDKYVAANPQVSLPSSGGGGSDTTGRPGYLDFLAPITRAEPEPEKPSDVAKEPADPATSSPASAVPEPHPSSDPASTLSAAKTTTIPSAAAQEHP